MIKTKIVIVGAGNISNTRHIPALQRNKSAKIVGVLSNRLDRAQKTAKKHHIPNYSTFNNIEQLDWLSDADAVVIGAPPREHYQLVKMFLKQNKHVLVEKPMMMNENECKELIRLSKQVKRIFYVMHNFQYANKMLKLNQIISSKKYGNIQSIVEVQFTNHDRRLPEWYNHLPMGLFYDEAAHFVYLLERHAGELKINEVYAVYDRDKTQNTPITLSVGATAGEVPITMFLNFRSPICEWYYIVNFKKNIFIYDFFKDILVELPSDNEHLAKDIFGNSIKCSYQYWRQFIGNGIKMIKGDLLYGHDKVLDSFIRSIRMEEKVDTNLIAENGLKNVVSINEIISKANSIK